MLRIFLGSSILALTLLGTSVSAQSNPAKEYCQEEGGLYKNLPDLDQGSANFCQFGEGYLGEWTFYRAGKLKESTLATAAFFRHDPYRGPGSTADPEMFYCEQLGGRFKEYVLSPRIYDYLFICIFSDDSQIGLMPLFWGVNSRYGRGIADKLQAR